MFEKYEGKHVLIIAVDANKSDRTAVFFRSWKVTAWEARCMEGAVSLACKRKPDLIIVYAKSLKADQIVLAVRKKVGMVPTIYLASDPGDHRYRMLSGRFTLAFPENAICYYRENAKEGSIYERSLEILNKQQED